MKAIVDPSLLIKELKKISPVIGKNQILPVLECVKLKFSKKKVSITGTNMDTWVTYQMACECKEEFEIVIPIGDMIDICSKASGPVLISDEKTYTKFSHDDGVIKIPISADPKDFPSIEDVEYFNTTEVRGDFFHAISGANVCRSRNDQLAHMNGIGIDFKKTEITVVGVDGQIMYKQDFPAKITKPVLISINTVFADLSRFFQESTISVSEKYFKVDCGTTSIVTRLSETKYVDYSVLCKNIPAKFNIRANRKDLLNKMDVIDIATTKSVRDILLKLTPGDIHMSTKDIYIGKEAESHFSAVHDLDLSVRIKGDIFKNLLSTITEEVVNLNISEHNRPIYIMPEDNPSVLLLIQPLMFNQ